MAATIRIRETERAQHGDLAPLHAARVARALVVVADQVQRAVHDEVRPVRAHALALRARLGAQHAGQMTRSPSGCARMRRVPRGSAAGNDSTLVGLSWPR